MWEQVPVHSFFWFVRHLLVHSSVSNYRRMNNPWWWHSVLSTHNLPDLHPNEKVSHVLNFIKPLCMRNQSCRKTKVKNFNNLTEANTVFFGKTDVLKQLNLAFIFFIHEHSTNLAVCTLWKELWITCDSLRNLRMISRSFPNELSSYQRLIMDCRKNKSLTMKFQNHVPKNFANDCKHISITIPTVKNSQEFSASWSYFVWLSFSFSVFIFPKQFYTFFRHLWETTDLHWPKVWK